MMRFLLISFLLFHCVIQSFAQKIQVVQENSLEPIAYANLYCVSAANAKGVGKVADAHGFFNLEFFKGCDTLRFSAVGFSSQIIAVRDLKSMKQWVINHEEFSLPVITVSHRRFDEPSRISPQKQRKINRDHIAKQNPATTAELLANTGEVFMQKSQQGGGSPMIRGFAANRLLIAVDGVRMNNAIFRGGNVHNILSINPYTVEQAQVVFGPGSVLYGSDAIGGVMDFKTLNPLSHTDSGMDVRFRSQSKYATANHEMAQHAEFYVASPQWSSVSAVTVQRFGNLTMGSNGARDEYLRSFYADRIEGADTLVTNPNPYVQNPSGYEQYNALQKFKYKLSPQTQLTYAFHITQTSNVPRYDRHIRYRNGMQQFAEWYYGPQKWNMHHLNLLHYANHNWFESWNLIVAYQFYEESRFSRRFNDPERFNRIENLHLGSLNWDFNKTLNKKSNISYGVETLFNQVQSQGSITHVDLGVTQDGPARYPNANWFSSGVYATYFRELNSVWKYYAGARWNYFYLNADFSNNLPFFPLPFQNATLNNQAPTGNTGMLADLGKKTQFTFNLSTGFRAPNVDDMGKIFDFADARVVVPNSNLAPEYAYNVDIGWTQIVGRRAKIDFSAYYIYLDGAMVRRNHTLNGLDSIDYDGQMSQVQAILNASATYIVGSQLNMEYKLTPRWSANTRLNYQHGKEQTPDGNTTFARHAAPAFGNVVLQYKNHRWQAMAEYRASAEVPHARLNIEEREKIEIYALDEQGNPFAPAWSILNLYVNYKINTFWSFYGSIENVTNQSYRPYSSGMVSPGRNFMISVKYNR